MAEAGNALTDLDPALVPIVKRESGGKAFVGYGGADLSSAPLSPTGFPLWEGRMGPAGISHAAGLLQIQPGTWDPIAKRLGITDFSPESQIAVGNELKRTQGLVPWAASERPGSGGSGGMPDLAGISKSLSSPSNQLTPASAGEALATSGGVPPQTPAVSGLAMMSLLAAGTHKFVPVSYDPFAVAGKAVDLPAGISTTAPKITAAAPAVAEAPAVPQYVARTGMRKAYLAGAKPASPSGAAPLGMDPVLQNTFAGVA